MRHLNDGVLRRIHDDPFAVSNRERDHLDGCARCRQSMARVAEDAAVAQRVFTRETAPAAASEPALRALRTRLAAGSTAARGSLPTPRRLRWAPALVVAPLVAAALVGTASAAGWLSVFSPTQVAPITLTAGELNGLPDLSAYGHMQVVHPSISTVPGAAAAATASGMHLRLPSSLPTNVPGKPTWEVVGRGQGTFTLDASAADAAAARAGRVAPSIPAALDGTSVTVIAGPAVAAVYGGGPISATGDLQGTMPTLVIAQGLRPTASTNGATLSQLESFLLSQPQVTPQLAAEIRAIGSPASTLPIPVLSGSMSSQAVTIDGVQGVAVGDSTGLGAAVIWERDGVVYAVGGLLPQSEVLDIARSLH